MYATLNMVLNIRKKMKHLLIIVFFLFSFILNADENKKVTVAIDYEYTPLTYKSFQKKPEGLFVEFWRLWSKKSGYEVEFKFYNWDDSVNAVKNGEAIFHSGLTPDEDWMVSSDKFYELKATYYKLKDKKLTKNPTIGSIDSYYSTLAKKKYPTAKIVMFKDYEPLLRKLLAGEIDILIDDEISVDIFLLQKGIKAKLEKLNDKYLFNINVITNQKNKKYINIFNKYFKQISKDDLVHIEKEILGTNNYYNNKSIFTREELRWIQLHPVIHVGAEMDWAPFDFVEDGKYKGLARDYLEIVKIATGLEFKYHTNHTWNELLSMFKEGKLDILPAIYMNEERKKFLEYTDFYLSLPEYYFTQKNYENIDSFEQLYGKKIALVKGYTLTNWVKQNHKKIIVVEKANILECLQSIEVGESVAYIGDAPSSIHTIEKSFLINIKMNQVVKNRESMKVYMGVQPEYKLLKSIINKTFKLMTVTQKRKILNKWIGHDHDTVKENRKTSHIKLTKEEKKYLKEHPVVKFAGDPNWLPFEAFKKDGTYIGIVSEHLHLMEQFADIKFKAIKTNSWNESVQLAVNGKVDVISGDIYDETLKKVSNPVKSYINNQIVIVTDQKQHYIDDLRELRGKKIAVIKGYGYLNEIYKSYPNMKFIEVENVQEGLLGVSSKRFDAMLGSIALMSYSIKKMGITDLKIVGKTDVKMHLTLFVAKQNQILHDILSKLISNITETQKNEIMDSWGNQELSTSVDNTLLMQIALVAFIIISIIFYLNRKMAKEIGLRKIVQQELQDEKTFITAIMNSQTNFVITSDGKCIKSANKSFLKFYNVSDIEEFVEKFGNCICDTFDTNASEEYIQKMVADEKWLDYVCSRPEKLHKALIKKDEQECIFSITAEAFNVNNDELKVAVFTDITEVENAKKEVEMIHKHTKESIEYASLIQGALIPDNKIFKNYFQDYFAIWHPKDTIGGDIYLFEELRDKDECLLMVIDCTGHGVPGAFVTMLVKAIERQITSKIKHSDEIVDPAKLLGIFNKNMKQLLRQETTDSVSNAGFDGAILYYNKKEKIIKFAGAETPLFYVEDGELKMIKGDRYSVGYKKCSMDYNYKEHIIDVKEGMQFYLTTDGYLDQNGGEKSFPFGKKRFKNIIKELHMETMPDQQEVFLNKLDSYQGDEETNDDVTLIGVKI
jgi:ABC-type amino acid transport substrate-binding protein/serine phosphatase RsbU (regulator of sigma subunit)